MITLLLTSALQPAMLQAQLPFVSPMFSDHMVLQRNQKDPVWGWTTPGSKVTVTIAGKSYSAVAGADGAWSTKVGPLKVGGPYELTVDGPQKVTFNDVLAGDVWICSGQSNMQFGLGNVRNPQTEAAGANLPNVRLYTEPMIVATSPLKSSQADWKICTPDAVLKSPTWNGFSAVAYYFGAKLYQDEKIPIGLVHTSWGGTPAESWVREAELSKFPNYKARLDALDATRTGSASKYGEAIAAWYLKNDAGSASTGGWQDPSVSDASWSNIDLPKYFQSAGLPEFNNQSSVVWLRKTITLSADAAAAAATLHFFADDNDATWVNGVKVGETDGYNVPRAYKIPAGTLKAGDNVIAVRVTDTTAPGGIYGTDDSLYLESSAGNVSLVGPWKIKLGARVTAANALPIQQAQDQNYPTVLFNGMIAPIAPFGIKGAIWYQGESNAGRALEYQTLLPTMITSWRSAFEQGSFPFLIVQLAGFGHAPTNPGEDAWAELREAQELTAKNLPNTGLATAVDVGEENDIHPKDKRTVGERLAAVAERMAYGQKVLDSGPTYRSLKIVGSSVEISFNHTEGGLAIKGDGPLFAVAGADKKWHWAEAKIEGNKVIVSSPDVPNPVAVRYYWATFLKASLYNGAGWPALPFRTDDWGRPGRQ